MLKEGEGGIEPSTTFYVFLTLKFWTLSAHLAQDYHLYLYSKMALDDLSMIELKMAKQFVFPKTIIM